MKIELWKYSRKIRPMLARKLRNHAVSKPDWQLNCKLVLGELKVFIFDSKQTTLICKGIPSAKKSYLGFTIKIFAALIHF